MIPKGQNQYIKEEHTTQWPKEKEPKNTHIKLKIE